MIDPKVGLAIDASLTTFSKYSTFNASPFISIFKEAFNAEADFLTKVDLLDEIFDDYPKLET